MLHLVKLQISMYNLLASLLYYCLNIFMQNEYGDTALFAACGQGHYDPAALLVDHRADVNYLSKVRPLHVHDQLIW